MLKALHDQLFIDAINRNLKEQGKIEDFIKLGKAKQLPKDAAWTIRFAGAPIGRITSSGNFTKTGGIKKFSSSTAPELLLSPNDPITPFIWSNSHPAAFQELAREFANLATQSTNPTEIKKFELATLLAWKELNQELPE